MKCPPNRYVIVYVKLVSETADLDDDSGAFALRRRIPAARQRQRPIWGWYVTYPLAKVEAGHFIDANVNGLSFETPTQFGVTGEEGQFWFLPGERIDFSVGSLDLGDALADRRVSPVDLFEGSDWDDPRVINMAWLLQSLDADGNPGQGAINITEPVVACLESALARSELNPVDFSDETAVGRPDRGHPAGPATSFWPRLTRDEAWENLVTGQKAGNLMKKNVSKTPGMKSDKAKIEILPVYVPAQTSDGTDTTVVLLRRRRRV